MEKYADKMFRGKEPEKTLSNANSWVKEQERYFRLYEERLRRINHQILKGVVVVHGEEF
jgi:hypothetical protein